MIKIKLTSVMVDDQDKAEKFYTEVRAFKRNKTSPWGKLDG